MLVQTAPNDLTKLFIQLNKFCFFCGVPNLSMYDMKYSKLFVRCFDVYRTVSNVAILAFLISQITAIFVQQNLSEKQRVNWCYFNISQTIIISYIVVFEVYKNRIKNMLHEFLVVLKSTFNDEKVQQEVIKKLKVFIAVSLISLIGSMLLITFEPAKLYVTGEGTFTVVITCWPKLNDTSVMANVVRIINAIMFWIFVMRVVAIVVMVTFATICLSGQYKNLQRFFVFLDKVFDDDLDAEEEQFKFEQSLKLAINMHSSTIRCLKQFRDNFRIFFSGQILINVPVLMLVMLQVMTLERTLMNLASVVATGLNLLITTGFFMCNAGDITIEAEALPTAMYCSGWHRCRGAGVSRLRRLLTISIAQAQIPITIQALGIMEMSYNSFLKIIKASYSVLSVLY